MIYLVISLVLMLPSILTFSSTSTFWNSWASNGNIFIKNVLVRPTLKIYIIRRPPNVIVRRSYNYAEFLKIRLPTYPNWNWWVGARQTNIFLRMAWQQQRKSLTLAEEICSRVAKNQIKSMFGRMFSKKTMTGKTEISYLHFTFIFLGRAVEIPCPTCPTQDKRKFSIYLSLDKNKCIKLIQICISYFD